MMRSVAGACDRDEPIVSEAVFQTQAVVLNHGGGMEMQILAVERRGGGRRGLSPRRIWERRTDERERLNQGIVDAAEVAAICPRRHPVVGDPVAATQGCLAVPKNVPGKPCRGCPVPSVGIREIERKAPNTVEDQTVLGIVVCGWRDAPVVVHDRRVSGIVARGVEDADVTLLRMGGGQVLEAQPRRNREALAHLPAVLDVRRLNGIMNVGPCLRAGLSESGGVAEEVIGDGISWELAAEKRLSVDGRKRGLPCGAEDE